MGTKLDAERVEAGWSDLIISPDGIYIYIREAEYDLHLYVLSSRVSSVGRYAGACIIGGRKATCAGTTYRHYGILDRDPC